MPLLAYNCSPEHILPPLMPNFCTLQRTIPRFRRKLSAQLIRKLSQRHSRLQTLLPDNSIPVNLERSPEPVPDALPVSTFATNRTISVPDRKSTRLNSSHS